MKLTKNQFDVLEALIVSPNESLEIATTYSKEKIDETINELEKLGYVSNGKITAEGLNVMESHSVKRAVFIAAGFGSRMVPATLSRPKPMVVVNGVRIIDTLIDAVLAAGIEEIVIVRGYLAEKFDDLLEKYPMIKFVENTKYNEANNILSSLLVKDMLCNAYLFEADLYLSNPKIIKKYHYSSNFLGIKMAQSNDWCFNVQDGIIQDVKIGGTNCYQEVGISYWDEQDGKKLSQHIPAVFAMPGGKDCYWEQVPLVHFIGEYKVRVRECMQEDIVEIDSYEELKAIDKSYE